MRVLVDYRSALRARTGAGMYVHELIRAYTKRHRDEVTAFSSSWKDRVAPGTAETLGARVIDRRVPVSTLNYLWHRHEWPAQIYEQVIVEIRQGNFSGGQKLCVAAGIVDEDIDAAAAGYRLINQCLHIGGAAHVA